MNKTIDFLQTKEWAEMQKTLGREVFFISGRDWSAFLVKQALPLGKNFLYCARGPVFEGEKIGPAEEFLAKARELAVAQRSVFVKWDPSISEEDGWDVSGPETKFRLKLSGARQPRHTVLIDLQEDESSLLANMREKTRYNIRLSERRGVSVRPMDDMEGLEKFWQLISETAARDSFSTHPKSHYEKLIGGLKGASGECPYTKVFGAEYKGTLLAAAIILYHKDYAVYLHGASSGIRRDVMAPYAMHWQIIKDAKASGFKTYDLWGIDDKNPRWRGFTKFKKGFGGIMKSFVPTYDLKKTYNRLMRLDYRIKTGEGDPAAMLLRFVARA